MQALTNPWLIDFLFLPLVGAFHGWLTNLIAIKLLFHPRDPYTIPGTPWQIWGVIPKRRDELAQIIGQTVERDLISVQDIFDSLVGDQTELQKEIADKMAAVVHHRLDQWLPSLIPASIRNQLKTYLMQTVLAEILPLVLQFITEMQQNMGEKIKIGQLVTEKLLAYDLPKLEVLVKEIAGKELKHIEGLGLVMGLFIGILQGLFLFLLSFYTHTLVM